MARRISICFRLACSSGSMEKECAPNGGKASTPQFLARAHSSLVNQCRGLSASVSPHFLNSLLVLAPNEIGYLYRFYDPNLQKWLNKDPFGDESSFSAVMPGSEVLNRKWSVMRGSGIPIGLASTIPRALSTA